MANPAKRLPANVPGDFYVDASCIDCGTCQWMAPLTFEDVRGKSRVHRQPRQEEEVRAALQALLSCPTASIGTERRDHPVREVARGFPLRLEAEGEVYHCGFHSEDSFGAASYLLRRPGGNVLVDSPRYSAPLASRIEELGGVRWMFLTHIDDVADHAKFRERFGCERVLHEGDARGELRGVERLVRGLEPVRLAEDLVILPTPGHTRGSACLRFGERYLLSGDTLAWDPEAEGLYAFRDACWYDWGVLRASLERLAAWSFSWILPGHGWRACRPPEVMAVSLRGCIDQM